jgi:hypothetical protein
MSGREPLRLYDADICTDVPSRRFENRVASLVSGEVLEVEAYAADLAYMVEHLSPSLDATILETRQEAGFRRFVLQKR